MTTQQIINRVAINSMWKRIYEQWFFQKPKRLRATSEQITALKSQAKLYVAIYG